MYAAALIDEHPILRLGLARILGNIGELKEVRVLDPLTLAAETPSDPTLNVKILLFGISSNPTNDRRLFDRVVAAVQPELTLLLGDDTDNIPFEHPTIVGRIRKSAPSALIEAAVRLVLAGGACFPYPRVEATGSSGTPSPLTSFAARRAMLRTAEPSFFEWPSERTIALQARKLSITPRHYEILLLRAHGLTPREVGRMLGISEATVKSHASAMYRRLGVSNYLEAVEEAQRRGVDPMRKFHDEEPEVAE